MNKQSPHCLDLDYTITRRKFLGTTALGSAAAGRFLGTVGGNSLGHLRTRLLTASRDSPGFASLGAISTLLALALIAGGLLLPQVKRGAAPRSVEMTPAKSKTEPKSLSASESNRRSASPEKTK